MCKLFKRIIVKGSTDIKYKGTLHYRDYSNKERIMMEDYLKTRGWQDLWHWNNWVKTEWFNRPTIDIDRVGLSLKSVYLSEKQKENKL
jgi:hypothetical protein